MRDGKHINGVHGNTRKRDITLYCLECFAEFKCKNWSKTFCDPCRKIFSKAYNEAYHKKLPTPVLTYPCSGCGKPFVVARGGRRCKPCAKERNNNFRKVWVKVPENRAVRLKRTSENRYSREHSLRTKYNMTLEEYDQMCLERENKCDICSKVEQSLSVDHCHQTNEVRGLLCRSCNRAMGQLGDNADSIRLVYNYLARAEGLAEVITP